MQDGELTVHNVLTETSSGRPLGTSTALSFTCTLPLVTNWITEELSWGLRDSGSLLILDSQQPATKFIKLVTCFLPSWEFQCWVEVLYLCSKFLLLTVGPDCRRLSCRLFQAGHSPRERQWEKSRRKCVGERRMCDKQMLHWLKTKQKQEPSQGVTVSDLWNVKVQHEGCIFTKTLRPDLVKKANMEWKMLSLSWGTVHGVGFLWGVQFPRPSATWNKTVGEKTELCWLRF